MMPTRQAAQSLREHLQQRLIERGADGEAPLEETILVRDGFYCGRRYHCDGLQAIWFAEENEVKFFGRDGSLCGVERLAPAPIERVSGAKTQSRAHVA